jgi:8-hydroxy-5-deazaflavin:NADPH oxidoreductase
MPWRNGGALRAAQLPAVDHNQRVTHTSGTVGILGGTGAQGRGLAYRLARAGYDVILGSRDPERAQDAADGLGDRVSGATLRDAAQAASIVIVAVPWDAHAQTLTDLSDVLEGRIVVDCVNPLAFIDRAPVALKVAEGSACQQAGALLPGSRVVGAFHHVAAPLLLDETVTELNTDVMVVGDDVPACEEVVQMIDSIPGLRGVRCGTLADAGQVEALTVNLIRINRRLKVHAGIRITGL